MRQLRDKTLDPTSLRKMVSFPLLDDIKYADFKPTTTRFVSLLDAFQEDFELSGMSRLLSNPESKASATTPELSQYYSGASTPSILLSVSP